jgi:hypothetical protein
MVSDRAHLRLLILEVSLSFLLVFALDRGVGWFVARTPDVPLPRLFGSSVTSGKFLAFRRATGHGPAPEVLLMGMSQMMRVNAQALGAALAAHGARPTSVFNFAAPFHSIAYDERLLRDLVLPVTSPTVIVYGVTPQALLNETITDDSIDQVASRFPVFGMYTGSPGRRLAGFATLHLNLLLYRDVMRERIVNGRWTSDPLGQQARDVTDAGDMRLLPESHPVLDLNPFERRNQKLFADFDSVLRRSHLFDHLEALAAFCAAHGIRLVVVNQPVHPLFLKMLPHGRQDYDRYLAALRAVAARSGTLLFEPIAEGIGPAELYQDTVHHNPAGGAWLTSEVARYLIDNRVTDR